MLDYHDVHVGYSKYGSISKYLHENLWSRCVCLFCILFGLFDLLIDDFHDISGKCFKHGILVGVPSMLHNMKHHRHIEALCNSPHSKLLELGFALIQW